MDGLPYMIPRVHVRHFTTDDFNEWDRLVDESWNGTFLHKRRFLAYHGERFTDVSLIIEDDKGQLIGVFPAAIDPADPNRVVSHPGSTYGVGT